MGSIFTISILQSALELGCIYALVALALFVSFSILNIADLSTDGCFTLGCAVCAMVTIQGHPILALAAAMLAGVCSGFITAFLQTKLGIESILAGIIVNTGLYTINIAVMGFASQVNLFNLNTRLGLSIRATGDNADMVKASSINPSFTITVGLCVANAMTALSGGVLAQYQKSCDINLGTGMVTIALASLIIGESIIGKGSMFRRVLGVVLGSCLYRFLVAVALRLNVPAEALKLVSAIIVAIAIAFPFLKKKVAFVRQKSAAQKKLKDNMRLAEANTKDMGGDR